MMKIKTLASVLRPREKAYQYGVGSLTDIELLALLIRTGTSGTSCIDIAVDLFETYGSINALLAAPLESLIKTNGISKVKAIELKAVFELASRLTKAKVNEHIIIDDPSFIIDYMRMHYGVYQHEVLVCFYLDASDQLLDIQEMSSGSINGLPLDTRKIINHALTINACGLIMSHNHPSGQTTPSYEDIDASQILSDACELMGIHLLDHIIVSLYDVFIFSKEIEKLKAHGNDE